MRRRQNQTPIGFAYVRLRMIVPVLLGMSGAFVPALHCQVALYTVLPSADNQTGLNGTGILVSSGNAMRESFGSVDQSITATYTGNLYSAAGNPTLASLKLKAIVSAQRSLALAPGSARMTNATTNAANRAGGGYAVAVHDAVHRAPQDPMAELSQSIGPAYGKVQHPGYTQPIGDQFVPASDDELNLEQIGGLERIGGLEKIAVLEQGELYSSASGSGGEEHLCGEGCGLVGASSNSISVARSRRVQGALNQRLEDRIQKLDRLTTINTEVKTGRN